MIHSSIENFQPELKLNSEPQPMVSTYAHWRMSKEAVLEYEIAKELGLKIIEQC